MAVNVRGGALEFEAVINANQFKAQIAQIEASLKSLTVSAEKEAKSIDNLVSKTAAAIASYATFAAGTDFISQIVKVRGEFQQLEVSFRTMLKNKGAADLLMAQAVDLAARTPFTLQDVGQGAKQLLAYGFAAQDITKNIEMLGNVASGVGAPLNDIVYLYGTLKTQGVAYNKDILQFTGRGIPIIAELAKQFGVTESEVKKLVEAGKVGFPQVEQAFRSMTSESGMFFNLMQEQSKTLTGLTSNLSDAWSKMLNDIGKSNEGVLTGSIKAAISLVENYEKVVDVLKVMVITYGSYRAALAFNAIAMVTATNLTKGYTLAQTLQYQAMLLSERAMKLLNAAMLTNPFILAATAIGALVAAMIIFKDETNEVRTASELLAESQKESAKAYSDQEAKIKLYISQLKAGNLNEKQRLEIYEKLKSIDPSIVKGIDAKTISYQNLTSNVEEYLGALRKKIALEANEKAAVKAIEAANAIEVQIEAQKKLVSELAKVDKGYSRVIGGSSFGSNTGSSGSSGRLSDAQAALNDLERKKALADKAVSDLGTDYGKLSTKTEDEKQVAIKRTISVIEDEIKAEKEKQQLNSSNRAEFLKSQAAILRLEKELENITGKQSTKQLKQANTDLQDLRKAVSEAEQDARQTGLTKQQSELDQLENRFNELRKRAQDLGAGNGVLQRIENASDLATGNVRQKQEFAEYQKYIADQEAVFTRFEELKLSVGKEKAEELTQYQTGVFENYLDFLRVQLAVIKDDNSLKGKLKKEYLAGAIVEEEKRASDENVKRQTENLTRIIAATETFNSQRLRIEEQYQNDLDALRKNRTGDDLAEREAALKQNRDYELADLQSSAARSSDIYKKLNEDILLYTRKQLIARRRELIAYLEKTPGITPAMRADIKGYMDQLNGLIRESGALAESADDFQALANSLATASSGFGQLAQATSGLNDDLSEAFQTMSDMTGVATSVAQALAGFASGNILGGITASISAIAGVISGFARAKRESERQAKELREFQARYISGEAELNQILRQRQLDQIRLNKLRLDGIAQEKNLLQVQKQYNKEEFDKYLKIVQGQTYTQLKLVDFLGIPVLTKTVETLAGKTYDQLEELFTRGQLEGEALSLFQTLQKIKAEGVDIDLLLQQNAAEVKELFTGTTSDSITDSIVDGFSNGLRSAADFADSFEDLMKQSILNALKFQALEGPLKEFYDQFAKNAESDGILTADEIAQLKENFNGIISNAGKKFDELQKITDINFDANGSSSTGLSGAIKGITEQQADLLAGQFGGLRLTAVDHLRVAQSTLTSIQRIENYTSNLINVRSVLERLELNGIKVK